MLKIYLYRGTTWQFEEGKQPDGAVEVKPEGPKGPRGPEGPKCPRGPQGEPGTLFECSMPAESDEKAAVEVEIVKAKTPPNKGRKAANK